MPIPNETTDDSSLMNLSSLSGCSQSSSGDGEPSVEIVTYVAMCLSTAGMLSNVVALVAVLTSKCQQDVLRLGLLSLSIADFLIALSTTGQLAFSHHWGQVSHEEEDEGEQWHRKEWCANEIFRRLWAMATDANQLTLIFLAAQQFTMLRWPLTSAATLSTGRATVILVALWFLSAVLGFASTVVAYAATDDHPNAALWPSKGTTRLCYQLLLYERLIDDCDAQSYKYSLNQAAHQQAFVWLGVALVTFVLTALCLSYGYMLAAFERVARLNESCQPLAGTSWRGTRRAGLLVTAAVTGVCIICYMPLFVYHTAMTLGCELCNRPIYFPLLMAVVCIAPVADPVIYTMRLKMMRTGLLAALRKCWPAKNRPSYSCVRPTVKRPPQRPLHSLGRPSITLVDTQRALTCDAPSF